MLKKLISSKPTVLLVNMPLTEVCLPNLAIETLASIGRKNDIDCETLYGNLLTPGFLPRFFIHSNFGPAIFTSQYFNLDPESFIESISDLLIKEASQFNEGQIIDIDLRETIFEEFMMAVEAADIIIKKCIDSIPKNKYDVIGFSVGFDSQKMPSMLLAKLLKEREPEMKILFGGTGCDGDMGYAVMEYCPHIDAVLMDEADSTFVDTILALVGMNFDIKIIPNLIYRSPVGEILINKSNKRPSLANNPLPDYSSFLKQSQKSSHTIKEKLLFFETSRGCWWGEKQHCTFCGIKAVDFKYRSLDSQQALKIIDTLHNEYNPDILYSTDAIMNHSFYKDLLPKLKIWKNEKGSSLKIFYEVKSNITKEQAKLMSEAGIKEIQPGIETFSSKMLSDIKKGATPLQQIELLKFTEMYGIKPIYGIIYGLPNETPEDILEMIEYIKHIHHLPPPSGINKLGLHKFSPYYEHPEKYNILNKRPFTIQERIYQTTDEQLLLRLCYEADYDINYPRFNEIQEARVALFKEISQWRLDYSANYKLKIYQNQGKITITKYSNSTFNVFTLSELETLIYQQCDTIISHYSLSQKTGLSTTEVDKISKSLLEVGLLVSYREFYLAIAINSSEYEY